MVYWILALVLVGSLRSVHSISTTGDLVRCSPSSAAFPSPQELAVLQATPPAEIVNITVFWTPENYWSIDQKAGQFQANGQLAEIWTDCRYAWNNTGSNVPFIDIHQTSHAPWNPQGFMLNARESTAYTLNGPRQSYRIFPDGIIVKLTRYSETVHCHFDLHYMPFDYQQCNIIWASVYSTHIVRYVLFEPAFPSGIEINNPEWIFEKMYASQATETIAFFDLFVRHDKVTFSAVMRRKAYYYMNTITVPVFMFWIISWCGLFISPDAVPARAAIGVIPILMIVNLSRGFFAQIPIQGKGVMLLDWLLAMNIFCMLHMVQYAIMMHFKYRKSRRANRCPELEPDGVVVKQPKWCKVETFIIEDMEAYGRWFWLAVMAIYNLVFWIVITQSAADPSP